jgi:hypothetical protein
MFATPSLFSFATEAGLSLFSKAILTELLTLCARQIVFYLTEAVSLARTEKCSTHKRDLTKFQTAGGDFKFLVRRKFSVNMGTF